MWVRSSVSPSSVASRHLPHPGEGFFRLCQSFLFYFSILPKNRRYFSSLPKNWRCFKLLRTTEGSLPPGGEGVAPATDEGETGERSTKRSAPPRVRAPGRRRGRCAVRSNNGDPACWRPARGAGFDCAALFGGRARRCTRCAASLRMTRRVAGARDGKQNAVSVSFTVLYFEPNKLRTTFHPTHCVILSEAAPPAKNQAHPPTIAAQSNPAPRRGASRRDLRC